MQLLLDDQKLIQVFEVMMSSIKNKVTPTDLSSGARPTVNQVAAAIDKHVAECDLNWQRSDEHRRQIWREICEVKKISEENSQAINDLTHTMIKEQIQNRYLIKIFGWFGSCALTILNGLVIYYLTVGIK